VIHENVELHNVAELRPAGGGLRPQRVPEEVRLQLNEAAQQRVLQPDNCELRFVCESGDARVTLSSEGQTEVTVFYGTFDARRRHLVGREPVTISQPGPERLKDLDRRYWKDLPFAPQVCRLVFGGPQRSPVVLHEVSGTDLRPPRPEELPTVTYLAYGTSITHGFDCRAPYLSYAAQTAWHLGADLVNLGVGGSCYCEKAFADHIAGRTDWQIASLALSVNMQGFDLEEFSRRVGYMVRTVAAADPDRPVACVTLYPYFRDLGIDNPERCYRVTAEQLRQALRDAVAAAGLQNLHLIEGQEMLTGIAGLTFDLLHPSDNAMIEMGRNLAGRLKPLLA